MGRNFKAIKAALAICLAATAASAADDKEAKSAAEGPKSEDRPLSRYCKQIEQKLEKSWKESPLYDKTAQFQIILNRDGDILDVGPARFGANTEEVEKNGERRLAALQNVGSPPESCTVPLSLSVNLANNPDNLYVMARDLDWDSYMKRFTRRIKGNWSPPQRDSSSCHTASFILKEDGSIGDIKLEPPSEDAAVTDAALAAIKRSLPFAPLPDGSPPWVQMEFRFDYNVTKKKKKASGGSAPAEKEPDTEKKDSR